MIKNLNQQESITPNLQIMLEQYNKLNRFTDPTKYPWDLRATMRDKYFIPTYKNVMLHYKQSDKLLVAGDRGQKNSRGGSNKVATIYLL